MTWSTSRSGIFTSAVDRKSTLLIHESTGGSSSGAPAVSTILRPAPRKGRFEYTPLLLKHCALGDSNESASAHLRACTHTRRIELFPEKFTVRKGPHSIQRAERNPRAPLRRTKGCLRPARRDHLRELRERVLDVLSRLRGREEIRGVVGLRGSADVSFGDVHLVLQIRLVREQLDWDVDCDLHDGRDTL